MISGELSQEQFNQLKEYLKAHELPPQKRQRLLYRIAKQGVIAATKRHVREQKNIDGSSFSPRKTHKKGKMLKNLPNLLSIHEMPSTESVRLYFRGGKYLSGFKGAGINVGVVAAAQQEGMKAKITSANLKNKEQKSIPATAGQAKCLRKLGYTIKQGKRQIKAPIVWIVENLSRSQAGAIIRTMREKPAKSSWSIDIPVRTFLGVSSDEFTAILVRQFKNINYGSNINAQDIKG